MPRKRRPRLPSRPLRRLPARCESSKRPCRADSSSHGDAEDGTPLTDEILVGIFAGLPEIADLVRCAATCSRWRRLVSSEAAFICRTPRPWPRRFVRRLALGFFHQNAAALRFTPMASGARLRGLLQTPSLNALVERPENGSFHSPRLVASRNGLIVADLRRGRRERAIKLCVCNPMTGEVNILPPLSDEDGLGRYACTVLTADDHDQTSESDPPPPPAYRVILFYNTCRSNTVFRSYSSEDGVWSPEAIMSERLGKKQMGTGVTRTAVVVDGGKVVCWFAKNAGFTLSLDTLHAAVLSRAFFDGNTILGVSPERRLCTIQMIFLAGTANWPRGVALRVSKLNRSIHQREDEDEVELIQVEQHLPADVSKVKLRWFCEKSGVVLFTAGYSDGRSEVYALSLDKKQVEKIASHGGGGGGDDPWENLHGYEMDRAAYLATLGVGYGTGG